MPRPAHRREETNEGRSSRAPTRQILPDIQRRINGHELTGSLICTECEVTRRSVNWRKLATRNISAGHRKLNMNPQSEKWTISCRPFCHAPANDEDQRHGDQDCGWNVAGARVNRWRDGRRQRRIEHALEAETEARDIPPQRIDDGGNAGI